MLPFLYVFVKDCAFLINSQWSQKSINNLHQNISTAVTLIAFSIHNGCVHLSRPELNSPPNLGCIWGRRLESHVHPVRGLDGLEVLWGLGVVLLHPLTEHLQAIQGCDSSLRNPATTRHRTVTISPSLSFSHSHLPLFYSRRKSPSLHTLRVWTETGASRPKELSNSTPIDREKTKKIGRKAFSSCD